MSLVRLGLKMPRDFKAARRVSDEQISYYLSLGLSDRLISQAVGMSEHHIWLRIEQMGAKHNKGRKGAGKLGKFILDPMRDQIIRDYTVNKMTLPQLVEKYGSNRKTMGQSIRRWGVRQYRGRKMMAVKKRAKEREELCHFDRNEVNELYTRCGTITAFADYFGIRRDLATWVLEFYRIPFLYKKSN